MLLCPPRPTEAKLINIDDNLQTAQQYSGPPERMLIKVTKVETRLPSAPVAQNPLLYCRFFFAFLEQENLQGTVAQLQSNVV